MPRVIKLAPPPQPDPAALKALDDARQALVDNPSQRLICAVIDTKSDEVSLWHSQDASLRDLLGDLEMIRAYIQSDWQFE
jgi:hypothetical protein